jgi:acetyl esterase/lipase
MNRSSRFRLKSRFAYIAGRVAFAAARIGCIALATYALFVRGAGDSAQTSPSHIEYVRTEDLIYGRKTGLALTLDVFRPVVRPNGHGIIYVVSGGWTSNRGAIYPGEYSHFLDRGYTVFAVIHSSQPKFTISEIIPDMQRAVRFIRFNSEKWGIDPDRIGITGVSSGGHLSLMAGVLGGAGDPRAADPVERESSAVQAVACFFPSTDFLNFGSRGEDAVGVGRLKDYRAAFGDGLNTLEARNALGQKISPICFITAAMPPTLIIHGDKDPLVPVQQGEIFVKRATEMGAHAELIVRLGGHGWPNLDDDRATIAAWFDAYLLGSTREGRRTP